MTRKLGLPDDVYDALREAVEADGMTPAAWISARLPEERVRMRSRPDTFAERFAGCVGRIASGGRERLSEGGGEKFADHLEAKRGIAR